MEQKSIEVVDGIVQVLWVDINGSLKRKTYCINEKEEFIKEVIGAAEIAVGLSW